VPPHPTARATMAKIRRRQEIPVADLDLRDVVTVIGVP
jgi:hypothetical protein